MKRIIIFFLSNAEGKDDDEKYPVIRLSKAKKVKFCKSGESP